MHGNGRLTPVGRLTMVLRIESGRPVAHVAAEMGISNGVKWWRRWQSEGVEGLVDRSSRPHHSPNRTSAETEAAMAELRQTNGKVQRSHRTLAEERAYVRPYNSEAERLAALDEWLHLYNHHRNHSALGGPPITRVNNLAGHYS